MTKTYQIPMTFDVKRLILDTEPTQCVITMNNETIVDSTDNEYGMFNFDDEAMDFLTNYSTEQVFEQYLLDFVSEYLTDLLECYNEIVITLK